MVWKLFYMVLAISTGLLLYGIYVIASARAGIDDVPPSYVYGPAKASLTVVEFMDFSCGHCRGTHPAIMETVTADGDVRYIPLPIAAPNTPGEFAMRLCYAAGLQGKYKNTYEILMKNYPDAGGKDLTDIALAAGLDAEKLKQDMVSPAIDARVAETIRHFQAMGGQYTPTFIVNGNLKFVPRRAATVEDFTNIFAEARSR